MWLNQKKWLRISPTKELDNKILSMAREKMSPAKSVGISIKWKVTSMAILASFVVLFVLTTKNHQQKEINRMVFTESPEMILDYNSIELMAATSTLSEEDWNKIESTK